jgi:regulator of protease activity HflC (stomatin/prohibitin superfamily)
MSDTAIRPEARLGRLPWRHRFHIRLGKRFWNSMLFGLLVLAFLVLLLWSRIFVTIPSGQIGILWLRFFGGTVPHYYFREGTKLILPWDRVFVYPRRLQRLEETITSLSIDGLPVTVTVNVMFMIVPRYAAHLHTEVGPDYVDRWVSPLLSSSVRERISSMRAEHVYTIASASIEAEIQANLQAKVRETVDQSNPVSSALEIVQFSIRNVALPPTVQSAIEAKIAAEQAVQRYRLSIDQDRLEAERRAIEAEGIRRFQEIVTPHISDSFLRWRGIEATLALSQSQNAKIVVIGNGSGLPLILDGRGDTAPAVAPGTDPQAGAPAGIPLPGGAQLMPAEQFRGLFQQGPPAAAATRRDSMLGLPVPPRPPLIPEGASMPSVDLPPGTRAR